MNNNNNNNEQGSPMSDNEVLNDILSNINMNNPSFSLLQLRNDKRDKKDSVKLTMPADEYPRILLNIGILHPNPEANNLTIPPNLDFSRCIRYNPYIMALLDPANEDEWDVRTGGIYIYDISRQDGSYIHREITHGDIFNTNIRNDQVFMCGYNYKQMLFNNRVGNVVKRTKNPLSLANHRSVIVTLPNNMSYELLIEFKPGENGIISLDTSDPEAFDFNTRQIHNLLFWSEEDEIEKETQINNDTLIKLYDDGDEVVYVFYNTIDMLSEIYNVPVAEMMTVQNCLESPNIFNYSQTPPKHEYGENLCYNMFRYPTGSVIFVKCSASCPDKIVNFKLEDYLDLKNKILSQKYKCISKKLLDFIQKKITYYNVQDPVQCSRRLYELIASIKLSDELLIDINKSIIKRYRREKLTCSQYTRQDVPIVRLIKSLLSGSILLLLSPLLSFKVSKSEEDILQEYNLHDKGYNLAPVPPSININININNNINNNNNIVVISDELCVNHIKKLESMLKGDLPFNSKQLNISKKYLSPLINGKSQDSWTLEQQCLFKLITKLNKIRKNRKRKRESTDQGPNKKRKISNIQN